MAHEPGVPRIVERYSSNPITAILVPPVIWNVALFRAFAAA
jgi:hypothetical protein